MKYIDDLNSYIQTEIEVLKHLNLQEIHTFIEALEEKRFSGAKIYICGNGGSAATASHFVCDFNKGVSERKEKNIS